MWGYGLVAVVVGVALSTMSSRTGVSKRSNSLIFSISACQEGEPGSRR
jgi:hypothetical protein